MLYVIPGAWDGTVVSLGAGCSCVILICLSNRAESSSCIFGSLSDVDMPHYIYIASRSGSLEQQDKNEHNLPVYSEGPRWRLQVQLRHRRRARNAGTDVVSRKTWRGRFLYRSTRSTISEWMGNVETRFKMFVHCKTGYEKGFSELCHLFRSRGKDAQVLVRLGCSPVATRRCLKVILRIMPIIYP